MKGGGYLITALLLPDRIEAPLVLYWDPEKMKGGSRSEAAQESDQAHGAQSSCDDGRGNEQLAYEYVRSSAHWGYGKMLLSVCGIICEMEKWAESCPCLGQADLTLASGVSWYKRAVAFLRESGVTQHDAWTAEAASYKTCPMRGRRCPELAAGRIEELLNWHADLAHADITMLAASLDAGDKGKLLTDWEKARQALADVLTAKFMNFKNNPYKRIGLAHHDESKAIECGQMSYSLAHSAVDAGSLRDDIHLLVSLCCIEPTILHEQFMLFIQRLRPLREMPELQSLRAKLKMIPSVERLIEAKHGRIKKGVLHATHHSGALVSLHLRMPELRRHIADSKATHFFLNLSSRQI